MKTINQYKVAEWLGMKAPTLANVFNGRRGVSRGEAVRLSSVSGIPFEDWMLSDGRQLKQKVFIAYGVAHENNRGRLRK